jgi:hypothetical protein
LNVESNKLKSIMKEVYIEALNTETTEWFYFVHLDGKIC